MALYYPFKGRVMREETPLIQERIEENLLTTSVACLVHPETPSSAA